jgi:hypothetical protein
MVDMDAYYADDADNVPDLMDPTTDVRAWISDCTCSVCSSRRDVVADKRITLFSDYEIYFKNKPEFKLQDHQYLLLPRSIWAYVFRTRTWGTCGPTHVFASLITFLTVDRIARRQWILRTKVR